MRLTHGWHVACLIAALLLPGIATAAPMHVVSTFLCTDEYVFRLVPRERIAALSFLSADRHPVVSTIADKVKGIRLIRGSAEEIMPLHPDLVVTEDANPRLLAQLAEAGIRVLQVKDPMSLADVRDVTRELGAALGESERAETMLAEMDRKLAAAARVAPHPSVRTLIYEPNGYATSGGVTNEILRTAGLENAGPSMNQTRLGTVPIEAVIASPPELLILNGEREATPSRGDLILRHPALRALPASTMIARAHLTPLLCPGPWSADVALPLAELGRRAGVQN